LKQPDFIQPPPNLRRKWMQAPPDTTEWVTCGAWVPDGWWWWRDPRRCVVQITGAMPWHAVAILQLAVKQSKTEGELDTVRWHWDDWNNTDVSIDHGINYHFKGVRQTWALALQVAIQSRKPEIHWPVVPGVIQHSAAHPMSSSSSDKPRWTYPLSKQVLLPGNASLHEVPSCLLTDLVCPACCTKPTTCDWCSSPIKQAKEVGPHLCTQCDLYFDLTDEQQSLLKQTPELRRSLFYNFALNVPLAVRRATTTTKTKEVEKDAEREDAPPEGLWQEQHPQDRILMLAALISHYTNQIHHALHPRSQATAHERLLALQQELLTQFQNLPPW
jgi:hypothetical protein